MAERTNVAVVLVQHLNKSASTNAKHRVNGSIAYIGAARASFLFARDREDPEGRRVLMLPNGCNLVADPPTIGYTVESRGWGPAVSWLPGTFATTADQALAAEADPEDAGERAEAEKWLRQMLARGKVLQKDIEKAGKDAGFSLSRLKRAKAKVGARSARDGFGPESRCYWTTDPDPTEDT